MQTVFFFTRLFLFIDLKCVNVNLDLQGLSRIVRIGEFGKACLKQVLPGNVKAKALLTMSNSFFRQ